MNLPLGDLLLFVIGTACVVAASWRSLRQPGSHGFYRFFAWEATLALIVLNRDSEGEQMISQALLITSLLLFIASFGTLARKGRAGAARQENSFYAWERTTTLITSGIYGLIRHPMYVSVLTLAWGMFFRDPSWPGLALALIASAALVLTAQADERECIAYFGDAYRDYMRRTRRFIPFLY